MYLNKLQLAAMVKAGKEMILADGEINANESTIGAQGLQKFRLNNAEFEDVLKLSDSLKHTEMISILSSMNYDQKKYVYGYLITIMAADEDIDDSEMKLLKLISALADFPDVSMTEAASFWMKN